MYTFFIFRDEYLISEGKYVRCGGCLKLLEVSSIFSFLFHFFTLIPALRQERSNYTNIIRHLTNVLVAADVYPEREPISRSRAFSYVHPSRLCGVRRGCVCVRVCAYALACTSMQ